MYACLGVTCRLHFWQNDRSLLRATAVTRGWNGHRIRVRHTKLTLEKKILPPLLPGFELATFRSRVWHSYQQAIPALIMSLCTSLLRQLFFSDGLVWINSSTRPWRTQVEMELRIDPPARTHNDIMPLIWVSPVVPLLALEIDIHWWWQYFYVLFMCELSWHCHFPSRGG